MQDIFFYVFVHLPVDYCISLFKIYDKKNGDQFFAFALKPGDELWVGYKNGDKFSVYCLYIYTRKYGWCGKWENVNVRRR